MLNVPASGLQRGHDVFGADVAFGERFFIHIFAAEIAMRQALEGQSVAVEVGGSQSLRVSGGGVGGYSADALWGFTFAFLIVRGTRTPSADG